jgi:hypothetical protein
MANEEHLAILRQDVDVWNAWRVKDPNVRPDLQEADLTKIYLSGANLRAADLRGVDLRERDLRAVDLRAADLRAVNISAANLWRADLRKANLNGTNLNGADLRAADLRAANLQRADLRGANLWRADFSDAILSRADFSEAILSDAILASAAMNGTIFGGNDLRDIRGLDTVHHQGPSIIGTSTLYRSGGKIPEVFLRGCGVPDSLIEYLPSLIGAMEPIQFYSCFLSYSTRDEAFVKSLHSKMRDNDLRVWSANEDLKGGYKLHEQIDEAIRAYDKFIIVLSRESLRSKWVMNEVRRTRKAELANNQRKFFPIGLLPYRELEDWECIDPETGTDLAAEIREYYVPDFRDWKNHDSFEKAFAQLLEGLKAVDAPPAPRVEMKAKPKNTPQEPEKIIGRLKQRLAILEEQAAIMGISVRPEIAIEIEDLRREIGELES